MNAIKYYHAKEKNHIEDIAILTANGFAEMRGDMSEMKKNMKLLKLDVEEVRLKLDNVA